MTPEELWRRTAHQLWAWYLKPAIERSEATKEAMQRGDGPPDEAIIDPNAEDSEEAALAALAALKSMLPGNIGAIPADQYRGE